MTAGEELLRLLGVENMLVFVAALARVSPLFLMAPLFSSRQLSPRVKTIIALALAIGLVPVADPGERLAGDAASVLGMLAVEFLVGFSVAFALLAISAALETAGTFLDFAIGFAFGAQIDPNTGNQNAVLARLYSLLGVIIFVTIGGDRWVIEGIGRTYELVPLGQTPDVLRLILGADQAFTAIFGAALQIAAPVLLALVLADAGFGLVTRVVPQLNVFAVGLPVKIIVGLLLIGISLPLVAPWVSRELEQSVSLALRSLRVA